MGAGRPAIELKDLPEGWKDLIFELSSEGASIIELAVELNISRDTFYELSKRDEEFSDTVKRCKDLSEAWWTKKGRKNLDNKDFSYTGWYMNMKNRFNWSDKQEVTHGGEVKTQTAPVVNVYNTTPPLAASEEDV